jgi:hypothetical protein
MDSAFFLNCYKTLVMERCKSIEVPIDMRVTDYTLVGVKSVNFKGVVCEYTGIVEHRVTNSHTFN